MEQRTLGRSSLTTSRLGLGLAALGRPGYINLGHAHDLDGQYTVLAMEARCHRVLDAAWAAGMRYFDAARSYGRAERFLASWLVSRGRDPEEVTVGSKWGYTYTADWEVYADTHEVKEHSLPVLRRQIRESREMLGRYLDLYQIHSVTLEGGVLDNAHILAELARLRAEGLCVGLTLTGPRQAEALRRAVEVRVDGQPLFSTVQATWNLLERTAGAALAEAHQAGMGVIVKEALANGRLTERNTFRSFAGSLALLRGEAERLGVGVDALALAAVLAQPWADVVLCGAATREQLTANLRALKVTWDDEAAYYLEPIAEHVDQYWEARGRLPWN